MHPYEFPAEQKGDVITAKPAVIKVQPPLELGCIVADCLGNLRSSLDYIAWELASKYSGPLQAGKDRITFPILDTLSEFASKSPACLTKKFAAVPAAARDLIDGIQPYRAGYEPLSLLNRLINSDKHRLPLLTVAYAETASIWISSGPSIMQRDIEIPGIAIFSGFGAGTTVVQRLNDEEALDPNFDPIALIKAAQKAATPGASEETAHGVKVDGQVTVFVSLDNPPMPLEPVDRMLERIVKCVADIVPMFNPFF